MSRCVRPRQEWGRGQNTRMGGSDPIAPQNRGPIPSGFGGHSRLLLLEVAARVLAAQRKKQKKAPAKNSVRHDVRQNVRRNKTKAWQSSRHHPNNQSQCQSRRESRSR